MAAKSSAFDSDLLNLIFNGVAIPNIADNAASSPLTNLYVSLHTASPTTSGNQSSSEAAYASYARVAVARTAGGWTITGSAVSPAATISFPTAQGGSETETYFAIGTSATGAGKILYWGAISPSITVSSGVQPQLTTASTVTEA